MGTPETKAKRKQNFQPVVRPPSVAQKIDLLDFMRKAGSLLDTQNLTGVLDGVKMILSPMVQWLDKPLCELSGFSQGGAATARNRRAMLVYDGCGKGNGRFLSFALERSGAWYVNLFDVEEKRAIRKVGSFDLAKLMLARIDSLIEYPMDELMASEGEEAFGAGLGLARRVLCSTALVGALMECKKTVQKTFKEREERERILRAWFDLLSDYTQAADPLLARGIAISTPGCCIFHEASRSTNTYLSAEALQVFWDVLAKRTSKDGYHAQDESRSRRSLEEFVDFLTYLLGDIKKGREVVAGYDKKEWAQRLFGFSSGRLPLTSEEKALLGELIGGVVKIT